MKTLIITNSYDVTTDILMNIIGNENVFRLNFDLLSDYSIYINRDYFSIKSPQKTVYENEISKVYWRKPFNSSNNSIDEYEFIERKQVVKQIFNILFNQGKAILVDPNKLLSIGKLLQLRIAKEYFNVPEWEMILNHVSLFTDCVTKSLSSSKIDNDKILYTTKVQTDELDLSETWHLQEYLEKDKDLTIVFLNGELFAFELDVNLNQTDWRKEQISNPKNWKYHKLNNKIYNSVQLFMGKLKLNYGRLDFIIYKDEYYFLEVNINGQWAFLDSHNEYGLLSAMSKCIHPLTSTIYLQ
jgi:hypothetical protein